VCGSNLARTNNSLFRHSEFSMLGAPNFYHSLTTEA